MSNKKQYIYDTSNGQVIALENAVIVEMDDETLEAVLENEKDAPVGLKLDDPWRAVWFTGAAIREHYENYDEEEKVEGLTDADLAEAGEWAMDNGFMWDSVYAAWDFGIEQVRKDREAGLTEPI